MTRAGGGGASAPCDLLGSPGCQGKLNHGLLSRVHVRASICGHLFRPVTPWNVTPRPCDVSVFLLVHLAASWLCPLPQGLVGRGGTVPRGEGQPRPLR